ncbi:QVPTGV class sortase B protein-sorting domain-containing protein [Peptoniphilaceae bacterium SGI.131]
MKRISKLFLLAALAVALLLPVNVRAANGPEVTKTLVKTEEKAITPTANFEFVLVPATVAEGTKIGNVPVQAGKKDLLDFKPNNFVSYTAETELVKKLNLWLADDLSSFIPGIYRYDLSENKGTVDGMTYDETKYTVDVYVTLENGQKQAKAVVYKGEGKTDASQINDGKSNIEFKNTYKTHKLTVKKVIEGNAADMGKKFKFTITVNGADGEKYATNKENLTLTSGQAANVELGHNESIEIMGLSEKDTYTVTEDSQNYTSEGQVSTAQAMGNADKTVTVKNSLTTEVPTGVVETVAPFVVLIGLSLVFAAFYFKKKKNQA